jgi:hypothetical protein
MTPFAPKIRTIHGGRAHLAALLRITASRVVDVRDPLQREYDRLAARAKDCLV